MMGFGASASAPPRERSEEGSHPQGMILSEERCGSYSGDDGYAGWKEEGMSDADVNAAWKKQALCLDHIVGLVGEPDPCDDTDSSMYDTEYTGYGDGDSDGYGDGDSDGYGDGDSEGEGDGDGEGEGEGEGEGGGGGNWKRNKVERNKVELLRYTSDDEVIDSDSDGHRDPFSKRGESDGDEDESEYDEEEYESEDLDRTDEEEDSATNTTVTKLKKILHQIFDRAVRNRHDIDDLLKSLEETLIDVDPDKTGVFINRWINARSEGEKYRSRIMVRWFQRYMTDMDTFESIAKLFQRMGDSYKAYSHKAYKAPSVKTCAIVWRLIDRALDHGFDPTLSDSLGLTGFHYLLYGGRFDLLKLLVQRTQELERNGYKFYRSLEQVNLPHVCSRVVPFAYIFPENFHFKRTRALEALSILHTLGLSPTIVDASGNDALHTALEAQRRETLGNARCLAIVRRCLDLGCDPLTTGSEGLTSIHLAVLHHLHPLILQLLLQRVSSGVSLRDALLSSDRFGRNILHMAAATPDLYRFPVILVTQSIGIHKKLCGMGDRTGSLPLHYSDEDVFITSEPDIEVHKDLEHEGFDLMPPAGTILVDELGHAPRYLPSGEGECDGIDDEDVVNSLPATPIPVGANVAEEVEYPSAETTALESLPTELLANIMSQLNGTSLASLASTSKALFKASMTGWIDTIRLADNGHGYRTKLPDCGFDECTGVPKLYSDLFAKNVLRVNGETLTDLDISHSVVYRPRDLIAGLKHCTVLVSFNSSSCTQLEERFRSAKRVFDNDNGIGRATSRCVPLNIDVILVILRTHCNSLQSLYVSECAWTHDSMEEFLDWISLTHLDISSPAIRHSQLPCIPVEMMPVLSQLTVHPHSLRSDALDGCTDEWPLASLGADKTSLNEIISRVPSTLQHLTITSSARTTAENLMVQLGTKFTALKSLKWYRLGDPTKLMNVFSTACFSESLQSLSLSNGTTGMARSGADFSIIGDCFPNLTHLDLSHNHLSTLAVTFGGLSKLVDLDVSYNRIESLDESLGESCRRLRALNLSTNNFTQLPPLPLSLECLTCDNNYLSYTDRSDTTSSLSEALKHLTKLQTLALDAAKPDLFAGRLWKKKKPSKKNKAFNWKSIISALTIPHSPMRCLRFSNHRLLSFPTIDLHNPAGSSASTPPVPVVLQLHLSGNMIDALPSPWPEYLSALQILDVSINHLGRDASAHAITWPHKARTQIGSEGGESERGMVECDMDEDYVSYCLNPDCEFSTMDENQRMSIVTDAFHSLLGDPKSSPSLPAAPHPHLTVTHTLTSLDISDNGLPYLPPHIGRLRNLGRLTCSYNPLTELPASLAELKRLRFLDLRNTLLSSMPLFVDYNQYPLSGEVLKHTFDIIRNKSVRMASYNNNKKCFIAGGDGVRHLSVQEVANEAVRRRVIAACYRSHLAKTCAINPKKATVKGKKKVKKAKGKASNNDIGADSDNHLPQWPDLRGTRAYCRKFSCAGTADVEAVNCDDEKGELVLSVRFVVESPEPKRTVAKHIEATVGIGITDCCIRHYSESSFFDYDSFYDYESEEES